MNSTFYLLVIFIFLTYTLVAFMPYWTRKTENFGVSIPESIYNRPDFQAMRKKYTTSLIVINIILFLLLIVARYQFQENTVMMLFIIVTFVYLLFTFILYLPFHNKMKKIKQSENWNEGLKQTIVIDPKFREEKLAYHNGWFLILTISQLIFRQKIDLL